MSVYLNSKGISVFVFLAITILGFLFNVNIEVKFTLILLFLISGMFFFRLELLYPFVWLGPTIFLYNTSVIILDFLNIREAQHKEDLLFFVFISLVTVFFYCYFFIKIYSNKKFNIKNNGKISKNSVELILNLLLMLLIFFITYYINSGIKSKTELSMSGGLAGFGTISKLFLFTFSLKLILSFYFKKKLQKTKVFFSFFLAILISVIIGERDVILTLVLISSLIWYIFFKPNRRVFLSLVTFTILLIPITSQFKSILYKNVSFKNENLFVNIFTGEFLSSGRNVETILSHSNEWSFFYGMSFFDDLLRSVFPPFIFPFRNSVYWFNYNFHYDSFIKGHGHGFSYLGEGYINYGVFGIFIWYLILIFIIGKLYKNSINTPFSLAVYLLMLPNIIYLQRGDLSYLFSPLIKQVLFFLLILKFINSFYKKKYV